MRKLLWFFAALLLEGCMAYGQVYDKPLLLKHINPTNSLHVARREPANFQKTTSATWALKLAVYTVAVGGAGVLGGAAAGYSGYSEPIETAQGNALVQRCSIPDYSKFVLNEFGKRLKDSLPGWPEPIIDEEFLSEDSKYGGTTYLIILNVRRLRVDNSCGLLAITNGRMVDPSGQVLWEREFVYRSSDLSRPQSIEELEASNCYLLKEELYFAAEKTAADFVGHLKSEIPSNSEHPTIESATKRD